MKSPLPYDPAAAVAHLRAGDPALAAVIDRVGPCTLEPRPTRSLFAALLRAIVHQQLNGKAAATIHARVLAALKPHGGATPAALEKTPDAALRAAGLSCNKLLSARDLAAQCRAGAVPTVREAHRLSDDELVARLTAVRGIGPWTVHMLLIFNLGRPDVLPTGDYAVRLAFQKLHRKRHEPTPETIRRHAGRWQPWRSVASWYLWRSLDLE
jgi:DNA-3-methyladenine glycosylase II